MKVLLASLATVLALVAVVIAQTPEVTKPLCSSPELNVTYNFKEKWNTMERKCVRQVKAQVHRELKAAMQYLAMGAHFSKDTVNRPGFAKLFFEAASEEREHAIKLLSYLSMRGDLILDKDKDIVGKLTVEKEAWASGTSALRDALEVEAKVTANIRDLIVFCEGAGRDEIKNDYHLVDYLTADFLTEQYRGQRDLAGKLYTLGKMQKNHGHASLAEFLFDKKLLNGEAV
ncbi:ferritin heavy chain [Neocloeon triangulifer]|uniref:ferritin heavy chain n=1 Tax=Neocloeon triangulifer TaxID=2078957 RepID=UPI00286F60BF|nr:ferritin heavy chain [Neocloeon triangulifer]XP_059476461.1 ferritin heavy chain [Neocloeon triangulifer]